MWIPNPYPPRYDSSLSVLSFFLFLCSSPGQSDSGAVCVGNGVAAEHRPGQKLQLALFRERPAAGDVSHRRLGLGTTVSL